MVCGNHWSGGPEKRAPTASTSRSGTKKRYTADDMAGGDADDARQWYQQSGSEHHPELVVKETLTFSTNPGRSQGEVLGIDVPLYPDAG